MAARSLEAPLLSVLSAAPQGAGLGSVLGPGFWGSTAGLAGTRGPGLGNMGDGGGARFSCLHNEILMTDPFS